MVRSLQEVGADLQARLPVPRPRPHQGGEDRLHEVSQRRIGVRDPGLPHHHVVSDSCYFDLRHTMLLLTG